MFKEDGVEDDQTIPDELLKVVERPQLISTGVDAMPLPVLDGIISELAREREISDALRKKESECQRGRCKAAVRLLIKL